MADLENVRVALRVRPLVPSEINRGCQISVEKVSGQNQVVVNNTDPFSFNFVFDWQDTQKHVYDLCVSDMLDKLFAGFNATILAYGQTGSGKTHTMGTAFDGSLDDNVGVIPRAMVDLFVRVTEQSGEFEYIVKCSFMELYQEQLFDLLSVKTREETVVEMREDRGCIVMSGLTEVVVTTAKETTDCLVRGSLGRAVASTAMNEQSSRSHAIFTVSIQATKKDESRAVITSKFHLVDLAGSERSKKTGATGDRFKEGVKINQGLLALGNVISALGEGKGAGYVRYRDSKLTRLLQDSLGGNSVTLMIACVSPADYNVAETLSTLRYADRARKIKNKPIVNQDPHAAEINRLKTIIQKLRVELLAKGGGMTTSLTTELENVAPNMATPVIMPSEEQKRKYRELQEKYRLLQKQWQITLHDVAEHEMRAHIAETAHENLKRKTTEIKAMAGELKSLEGDKLEEKVKDITQLIESFDQELGQAQTEILKNRKTINIEHDDGADGNDDGSANSTEMKAIVEERTEAFTNKQMEINDQIRRINLELNLKEELQQRMAGNFTKLSFEDDMEDKIKECEEKITELETEKADLLDKLRHVKENTSAKLAEERRKRLQILEHEISEMKRKNISQAKLLKVREKESQKIKNLSSEIQSMKESKVKLIRAMRQESENFRQFKMMREKEVIQLKNKDRKMQSEMVRKEALHNKQRNVLKRKCEEAQAINKRLKDALEKARTAKSDRQQMSKSTRNDSAAANAKLKQIQECIKHELELIISVIDAEGTLEQLMDDRSIINSRICELKQQIADTQEDDAQSRAAVDLASLQEEFEMRNAQIADLQQKMFTSDIAQLIINLSENFQNLSEARHVLNYVMKFLCDMRRDQAHLVEELRSTILSLEEKCNDSTKTIQQIKTEHAQAISEYEEKISLALTPEQVERLKLQEEQERKIESLMVELENCKQMRGGSEGKKTKKMKIKSPVVIKPEIIDDDEEDDEEDEDSFTDDLSADDPDWTKTPRFMRRRRINSNRSSVRQSSYINNNNSQSDVSNTTDGQDQIAIDSANSGTTGANSKASNTSKSKRKSKSCSCRGNCGNQRCGCNSLHQKCTLKCRCSKDCINREESPKNNSDKSDDGQAVSMEHADETNNKSEDEDKFITKKTPTKRELFEETYSKENGSVLTPKMARLSTLTFETATAKKKFFQN